MFEVLGQGLETVWGEFIHTIDVLKPRKHVMTNQATRGKRSGVICSVLQRFVLKKYRFSHGFRNCHFLEHWNWNSIAFPKEKGGLHTQLDLSFSSQFILKRLSNSDHRFGPAFCVKLSTKDCNEFNRLLTWSTAPPVLTPTYLVSDNLPVSAWWASSWAALSLQNIGHEKKSFWTKLQTSKPCWHPTPPYPIPSSA